MDRSKSTTIQSGKSATIENQIQITPILDTTKPPNASLTGTTTTTQLNTQSITHLNNSQTITMNLPSNQPMLNIPNNMQITTVASNNTSGAHANIITNSMATNTAQNGGGVLSFQTPIGLQRQSTIQSSPVHTINSQGSLISSSGDQR